jgi:hypothetical protein
VTTRPIPITAGSPSSTASSEADHVLAAVTAYLSPFNPLAVQRGHLEL